jgi:GT2 family glycosyltransferase
MIDAIHALVVTYNRRELLMRNIQTLMAQTYPLASITLIDNGSTDGTKDAIRALNNPLIDHQRLEQNTGAAGGFHYGIEYIYARKKVPWAWIMDDDVMPAPTALQELVAAYQRNFKAPSEVGFLVSQAVDGEGRAINVPTIDQRVRPPNTSASWGLYLDQGIVSIRTSALSSMLMPLATYQAFGNLNREFVIWGEDTDLTFRITEQRPGLIVGRSKVDHLRGAPGNLSIFTEDDQRRVPNFYYLYRNSLYVRRRYIGMHAYFNGVVRGLVEVTKLAAGGKWKKAEIALRGTAAGIVFNPKPVPPGST